MKDAPSVNSFHLFFPLLCSCSRASSFPSSRPRPRRRLKTTARQNLINRLRSIDPAALHAVCGDLRPASPLSPIDAPSIQCLSDRTGSESCEARPYFSILECTTSRVPLKPPAAVSNYKKRWAEPPNSPFLCQGGSMRRRKKRIELRRGHRLRYPADYRRHKGYWERKATSTLTRPLEMTISPGGILVPGRVI